MFANHAMPSAPPLGITFDLNEMIRITTKLSDILIEENALLAEMKMKELAPLQQEKQKLSQQLETFQRVLATDDSAIKTADPDVRLKLATLTDTMFEHAEEAMQRTMVAQNINQRVLHTIIESLAEQQRLGIYGQRGKAHAAEQATLSISINERA